MDKNMVIQHVQFGEVAAYLLDDQEVHTDKDKEDKGDIGEDNGLQRANDISQNADHYVTHHAFDTDIAVTNTTDSSSSSSSSSNSNNSSSSKENMQRPRTFLAQYAISEIPTLIGDVSPFPEIIKTGDKAHTVLY